MAPRGRSIVVTAIVLRAPAPASARRDSDVHAWALRQEQALREGRFADLDLTRLADEIDALGNSQFKAFESALTRLLQHLLKWDFQPERRSRSWALTVRAQRIHVGRALQRSPSLSARRSEILDGAYGLAQVEMLRETGLPDAAIPDLNPYSWDEAMTREIAWPEP